jgi:hypothetical protein
VQKKGAKKSTGSPNAPLASRPRPILNSSVFIYISILLATVKDEAVASCYSKTPQALYCVLLSFKPQ